MKGLSAYYSREKRIRDASVNAVTYPVVLALMLLVIVFVMIVTVMPVFQQMLSSMGVAMTATGLTMMHLGTVIGWVVLGIVGAAVLAVLVCTVLLRLGNRSAVMAGLMKLLPPLRRLNGKLAASRVFSVLSMMLSSGFPLDEALRMVPPVLEDEAIAARVKTISEDISEGVGFGDALEKADLLDPIHTRMIRMAHTIGREDEVMARIAATYEEQVEDGMSDLVSIIEPTLVALLCLVIGAILLSVMLPMAGIISSIL